MLAVIIGANPKKSRVFYAGAYDPDNPGPPDCFSDNGLAPSTDASNTQAYTCEVCEWGKWGSDPSKLTGKKTKACNEKKKIAVIVVGDTTGLSYELQIPPATLKNMATYTATLAQGSPPGEQRKADASDMVTAISFVPGQTGILEFSPFAWLTSAYIDSNGTLSVSTDEKMQPLMAPDDGASIGERIDDIWEAHELDDLLGLNDKPWTPPPNTSPLPGMVGYMEPQGQGGALQRGTVPAGTAVHGLLPSRPTTTGAPAPLAQSPYAPAGAVASPYAPPAAAAPPTLPQQAAPPLAAPTANVPATTQRARKPRQAAAAPQVQAAPFPQSVAGQPQQQANIPDFLRRGGGPRPGPIPPPLPTSPAVPTGPGPAANPPADGAAAYGMMEAEAPPAAIENVLAAAIKLNTTRT